MTKSTQRIIPATLQYLHSLQRRKAATMMPSQSQNPGHGVNEVGRSIVIRAPTEPAISIFSDDELAIWEPVVSYPFHSTHLKMWLDLAIVLRNKPSIACVQLAMMIIVMIMRRQQSPS